MYIYSLGLKLNLPLGRSAAAQQSDHLPKGCFIFGGGDLLREEERKGGKRKIEKRHPSFFISE